MRSLRRKSVWTRCEASTGPYDCAAPSSASGAGECVEEGGGREAAGGVCEAVCAARDEIVQGQREKELYARIGQLQMELDWLKKIGLLGE